MFFPPFSLVNDALRQTSRVICFQRHQQNGDGVLADGCDVGAKREAVQQDGLSAGAVGQCRVPGVQG